MTSNIYKIILLFVLSMNISSTVIPFAYSYMSSPGRPFFNDRRSSTSEHEVMQVLICFRDQITQETAQDYIQYLHKLDPRIHPYIYEYSNRTIQRFSCTYAFECRKTPDLVNTLPSLIKQANQCFDPVILTKKRIAAEELEKKRRLIAEQEEEKARKEKEKAAEEALQKQKLAEQRKEREELERKERERKKAEEAQRIQQLAEQREEREELERKERERIEEERKRIEEQDRMREIALRQAEAIRQEQARMREIALRHAEAIRQEQAWRSPLWLAVRKKDYKALEKVLLDCNIDINIPHEGYTPLLYATKIGDMKSAILLVEKHASVMAISPDGKSVMDYAQQWLETGPSIFIDHQEYRINLDALNLIQKVITYGNHSYSYYLYTYWYTLIEKCSLGTIKIFLHYNTPNINCYFDEETPLYLAMTSCRKDKLGIIKVLLDAGANPNAYIQGKRLLDIAADCNNTNLIDLLIKYGATL